MKREKERHRDTESKNQTKENGQGSEIACLKLIVQWCCFYHLSPSSPWSPVALSLVDPLSTQEQNDTTKRFEKFDRKLFLQHK